MNCEQVRDSISSYIDNELTKEEKIKFEAHIKECKDCYEEYRSIFEVVGKLSNVREKPMPEGFRSELKGKLENVARDQKNQHKPNIRKPKFNRWTSIAAILLVGIVITAILNGPYSPFGKHTMDFSGAATEESGEPEFGMSTAGDGVAGRANDMAAGRDHDMAYDIDEQLEAESKESSSDSREGDLEHLPNMQERIIYSARLVIQVDNLDRVFQDIIDYTKDAGGFIQNSYTRSPQNVYSDTGSSLREGYLYLRIPSEKFDDAIKSIGEMGNVIENQRNGENITTQYRDIETELSNLEVQEERILEIMKKADQVEDILNIERELNRIRTEINQRKNILKNWDQLVDYSSIEVSLREEKFSTSGIQGSPFKDLGGKIQKGFIQSINLIVAGIAKGMIFIARAIPFIILLILLYMIYRRWFRERLLKRLKK